ncbi:MAG TPA: nicotinate phosphoribosyltransferase [Brumimicrobium sp.]|nr:nicotinate phosphoribosyltransferase [Brumimicrobium sp.]
MILNSILDNDFYKFTMQNAVVKLFPYAKARYQFINRGKHEFPDGFSKVLQEEVNQMIHLRLTASEKQFLQNTCPYLDPTYIDFLSGFQYDPSEVSIVQNGSELVVTIEGSWYRTILWEVPIMALISELYYKQTGQDRLSDEKVIEIAKDKILNYKELGLRIADFGTRRRHSLAVQKMVIKTLKENGKDTFMGTSNVSLAHEFNTKPIGTHAHEWFMFHAARYGFKMSNAVALENWVNVYRGDLGIALSDTYTSKVFFDSFDKKFSKLFDGVRHDSGDPIEFAKETIAHYQSMNIDPLTKAIIFSDGLNPEKVSEISAFCKGKIGMSFGIGTNFTNDVGLKPMNIVLKMTEALPEKGHWTGVVKLSDERGKYTGSPKMIDLAKQVLEIED